MSQRHISLGADHAGFELKETIRKYLENKAFAINDAGTYSKDSVDYPDFAHKVANDVSEGDCDLGILVCGSANGVCITANKHQKIRAAIGWLPEIAALAKQHNDANVLCLPARFISEKEAFEILEAYLSAEFEGGRHGRRVDKIACC